eukprot:4119401-Pyramimonas_sp.AAC.1
MCHSTQHFRRECPRGDVSGRGQSSMQLAQTDSCMQHVDWETLLTEPADNPAAAVNFMAAGYLRASMSFENCADELFEEMHVGHNEINLADWLGMPIAGQPAPI